MFNFLPVLPLELTPKGEVAVGMDKLILSLCARILSTEQDGNSHAILLGQINFFA